MTTITRAGRRLRCRLGLHKYVLRESDGEKYDECEYCGKYDDNTAGGHGTGLGAGL